MIYKRGYRIHTCVYVCMCVSICILCSKLSSKLSICILCISICILYINADDAAGIRGLKLLVYEALSY
jgi:hypothetical protein